MTIQDSRPHIVLVVARGEAVRNFIFSDTLRTLAQRARVTLLSLVDRGDVIAHAQPHVERIVPLKSYSSPSFVPFFHDVINTAHYRWIWTEAAKYYWGKHNKRVQGKPRERVKLFFARLFSIPFANRAMLKLGTRMDRWLQWRFRRTPDLDATFRELKPDLVFNCSHIHGPQADIPLRVAHGQGFKTAAFLFSWDNLTSRGRIMVPYDFFLVWTEGIKKKFLDIYPDVAPERVTVTGTPQFDFHFDPRFHLTREELCRRVGLNPSRPFILYTTGMDPDFAEEYRTVRAVIDFLQTLDETTRPQLLVRTYIKGNSKEMVALAEEMRGHPDVIFPPILWDKQWVMPLEEDLYIYTNLLRHCALGVNGASTVTLELMMMGKPVINLAFEPPGSQLPHYMRFSRHINYEHYRPVAASGGAMVARSVEELKSMILRGLSQPEADREAQTRFLQSFFGDTLDGKSGVRVAEELIRLAVKS
jgi:glycosyltransferase involved in cell wall biosynthesis